MAFWPNGKFKKYYLESFNGQNGLGQVSTGMLEDIGVKKDTSKILGQTPPLTAHCEIAGCERVNASKLSLS